MDRIERETLIDASLERVWQVLTHAGSWLGEADPAGFVLKEGETYYFTMGEVRMPQLAVKIEPMSYISYRWAPYTVFRGEEPRAGNSTLVEFILSQQGDKVRLQVVESGFDSLDTAEDLRRKAEGDNTRGWDQTLPALKMQAEAQAA